MFHYYGRKKKLSRLYPTAEYNVIIEPFAGSAGYSCQEHLLHKEVILIDKDEIVCAAWRRILSFTDEELRNLTELRVGDVTSDPIHLFHMASKRWWTYKKATVTPIMAANWSVSRRSWVTLIPRIRHWTIICGDYTDAPDVVATWFVDPPYIGEQGTGYRHSSKQIDFQALSSWCLRRQGQLIACGSADDTWLPFRPLGTLIGVAGKRSNEGIFIQ